ncbi:hypothetical protein H8788_15070 [Parabacteroides faecis]|uniref:hypothetical protein n=1 Tax=Parabacteroides faecis TaxID=1217282 RepID=UPI001656708C|nr:hypothetical protein [Parabacteroides faecis]MBC8619065.1 hypothetical protein [Parabacteroides faecis]
MAEAQKERQPAVRQLKLTANEPVIAKPLDYGIASFDEYKLIAISIGILAH